MSTWLRLKKIAGATPVLELVDAKRQCRVDFDDDDQYLMDCIEAATAMVEGPNGIGLVLGEQTWELSLDCFPREIRIPLGPVLSVVSITYTKSDGTSDTVTGYRATDSRVWPPRDSAWPTAAAEPGSVRVRFTCGHATIPADLKAALRLLVGHLYEHREAVTTDLKSVALPMGVDSILERYRVGRVA